MSDAVDVLNGVIAARDYAIKRLQDDLARMYRLRRECHTDLTAERALADDLMAWIETCPLPSGTKAQLNAASDALDALKARYREARGL